MKKPLQLVLFSPYYSVFRKKDLEESNKKAQVIIAKCAIRRENINKRWDQFNKSWGRL